MSGWLFLLVLPALLPATAGLEECQCGVFLLPQPPLAFHPHARPVLAGNPVPADCGDPKDEPRCSLVCRQLVQAMGAEEALVQSVVLAATRTLACQRANGTRAPLPRSSEDPRWLGGFYRWCSDRWTYAGVALNEPLCCQGSTTNCAGSARRPRLIIKKRPDDDISSEESTAPPIEANEVDYEKIDIASNSIEESPIKKKLNATLLAEAFGFVGSILRVLGYEEFLKGFSEALPSSTASDLLERVDVGGYIGSYQDKYRVYSREFNLGFCYVEYGMFSVANDGITNVATGVFDRIFRHRSPSIRRVRAARGQENDLLASALPLVTQVASSPMIQNAVSNLVTSFLTPPKSEPQQGHNPPRPASMADALVGSDGLPALLSQVVNTYLKFVTTNPRPRPKPTPQTYQSEPQPTKASPTSPPKKDEDIVSMVSEVAKPFFISWFGVVPDTPGFGQLPPMSPAKVGYGSGSDKLLGIDPDPGAGITDILFGSVNIPSTGNGIYDFGNRVVYAFSKANEPQQGLYCFKQYAVNKMWDYFKFGVNTVFKK